MEATLSTVDRMAMTTDEGSDYAFDQRNKGSLSSFGMLSIGSGKAEIIKRTNMSNRRDLTQQPGRLCRLW
ncbi:hypothetical protein Mp_1g18050 [Marchantia polymorpha subsp. ruderalis]|uniref:Uncharacterized protein n=2 Tax=Marchantia polymorpha TaxID=3197 RepID=A0AAF6ARF2_MARPO|nr:hypothetical protein MARPO_0001s0143 [Marchantia polymorpha]BBM99022.1 hypothetical protein Mp_1g18050 [Marchantia polymorpha subsp. ruderalis]|eukprot:PTQ50097.1 hypothetical protein MARPO_0001s0143 [Marchantia polymorpha]